MIEALASCAWRWTAILMDCRLSGTEALLPNPFPLSSTTMAAEKMTMGSTRRWFGAAIMAFGVWFEPSIAQSPATSPGRVIIPSLASATRPADLGFEGVECERTLNGQKMECTFQQVFLTTSAVAPDNLPDHDQPLCEDLRSRSRSPKSMGEP